MFKPLVALTGWKFIGVILLLFGVTALVTHAIFQLAESIGRFGPGWVTRRVTRRRLHPKP